MMTEDEQAIMNETASFAEAWSRGDAKAAASYYTEDGTRVGAFGDMKVEGRWLVLDAHPKLFPPPPQTG